MKRVSTSLKHLWLALYERLQPALSVIDDALGSENWKERVWAVELLLKQMSGDKAILKELQILLSEEFELGDDRELAKREALRHTSDPALEPTDDEILFELERLFGKNKPAHQV